MYGEKESEFGQKYAKFINPVTDPAKLEMIKGKKKVRVLVQGVFDMFHFGHANCILQAKNMFPNTEVVVGVTGGADTTANKGKTVMTEEERCESVRQCRYVDEVICPSPWVFSMDFMRQHNIDFIARDDEPYPMGDNPDIFQEARDAGVFLAVIRTEDVSTSDYIARVICEYDRFLQRNLARGYSREDLGITYLYEKGMEVRMRLDGVLKTVCEYIYAAIAAQL